MIRFTGIAQALTMVPSQTAGDEGEHAALAAARQSLGVIDDAVILADVEGRISWVGRRRDEPASPPPSKTIDLGGAVVMPGLVEAHTHLVFAGDRTRDFALRCSGVSYEEVARLGGGIRLTVAETRDASVDALVALARPRLESMAAHGVTTVEIKSGYGLSLDAELKMLEAIRRLGVEGPCRVVATVLAAHIVPDELRDDRSSYVQLVCDEMLPEVAARGLARHVDVFCDDGAFTLDETVHILERGRALGFGLKVHAEQLTHTGASGAAARLGAVSADHLEHVSEADIEAMSEAQTAGVLLPGAAIYLGGGARAPARRLLDAGVPVALSTDCNPGTCPSTHLPLMVTLGCTWLGMRPEEALVGVTRAAATAVGLDDGTGTLQAGGPCDLAVCDAPSWLHVPYWFGHNPVREVWVGARQVGRRPPSA